VNAVNRLSVCAAALIALVIWTTTEFIYSHDFRLVLVASSVEFFVLAFNNLAVIRRSPARLRSTRSAFCLWPWTFKFARSQKISVLPRPGDPILNTFGFKSSACGRKPLPPATRWVLSHCVVLRRRSIQPCGSGASGDVASASERAKRRVPIHDVCAGCRLDERLA
jgi:hypothetical protein